MAAPDFVDDIAQRLQGQLGEIDLVSARCTYLLKPSMPIVSGSAFRPDW